MKHLLMAMVGVVGGGLLALGVGCENQNKLDVVVEEGANAPRANLPAVPTLPPPPYPVQYPDGAYSVYGVRHTAARNWGKQVNVRGFITKVYVPTVPGTNPPRRCTERDRCLEDKPHVFLADAADETDPEKLMVVTGYASFQSDIDQARAAARAGRPAPAAGSAALQQAGLTHAVPVDFDQGAQVTVTGSFRRRASNGKADSSGLLEYASHVTAQPAPTARR